MQVDGDIIEAGSKVVLTEKAVSKVKGTNMVSYRQQFCRDEMTGTIRSLLRYYCLDIDQCMSDTFLSSYCDCDYCAKCTVITMLLHDDFTQNT